MINKLYASLTLAYAAYQLCQNGVWNNSMVTLAGTYNTAGSSTSLLSSPYNVFVDGNNNVFVADYSNNRIQRFPAGKVLKISKFIVFMSSYSRFSDWYQCVWYFAFGWQCFQRVAKSISNLRHSRWNHVYS